MIHITTAQRVCFEGWFLKIAFPFLRRKEGRKILIGNNCNNHASHLSYKVIKSCVENEIHFLFHPLNVAVWAIETSLARCVFKKINR